MSHFQVTINLVSKQVLVQNVSKMERNVICMKMEMQMKQIFIGMVICTMTRLYREAKGNS